MPFRNKSNVLIEPNITPRERIQLMRRAFSHARRHVQQDVGESHVRHLRRGRKLLLLSLAFTGLRAGVVDVFVLRVIARFACR